MMYTIIRFLIKSSILAAWLLYLKELFTMGDVILLYLFVILVLTRMLPFFEFQRFKDKVKLEQAETSDSMFYVIWQNRNPQRGVTNPRSIRSRSKRVKQEYVKRILYSGVEIMVYIPSIIYVFSTIFDNNVDHQLIIDNIFFISFFAGIMLIMKKEIMFTKTLNVITEYDIINKECESKLGDRYIKTPSVFYIPYSFRYLIVVLSFILSWFSILLIILIRFISV